MTTEAQPAAEVHVEADGGVLVITIDRPGARNAVNENVARAVAGAADRLDSDPALQAGVITGAGGTFCAGMDLKAFVRGEHPVVEGRGFAGLVQRPPRKPLIAAVEGYALAGGFEIVLACDLVVAARGATFGIPEVKRSLVAAGGGLLRLPRRVPYHVAMELALLGDHMSAARMSELGLVNRLVDDGEALGAALGLAREVAANGPLALAASKRIIVESAGWGEEESWIEQDRIARPVAGSADAREGATAFAEKRPPVWQGR
ncbi:MULTISPECIES: crotonase/enoyl-CoA hydratase family protein [Actinomadura]|uniref:Crotonase/enoyl-CoA hydratase family protein n=1 Tax=Actinomadura geliboluensis TaxID=882440 RepID=A0A5S4GVW4_9ACTN|nr:crotonase/enoyl-CoA hydratase family protein [Actinomadura geliboluensis]TMR37107.1 crotonase/enoyl-CoA hydratase family protein [Actinomadura geliboluensis]